MTPDEKILIAQLLKELAAADGALLGGQMVGDAMAAIRRATRLAVVLRGPEPQEGVPS